MCFICTLLRTVIYVLDALSVCFEMMYRAGVQTVSQLLSSEWSSHIGPWHNRTLSEQPFSWGRMFSSYGSGAVLNHILHSLSVMKVHPWSTSQTASVWSHVLGVWCITIWQVSPRGMVIQVLTLQTTDNKYLIAVALCKCHFVSGTAG